MDRVTKAKKNELNAIVLDQTCCLLECHNLNRMKREKIEPASMRSNRMPVSVTMLCVCVW